ncbi:hypothetical protein KBC04_00900 [Candidatus Babeliales bacterium]|nr:hypothetical protein [Candidatus Babeliales bacterium]MBP9843707.1 hypothetical protein [Candidatus Babeliales bacterium]
MNKFLWVSLFIFTMHAQNEQNVSHCSTDNANVEIHHNIFLQQSDNLTDDQIEIAMQSWGTSFCWNFGYVNSFTCSYEEGKPSILFQVCGIPVRSYNFDYYDSLKQYVYAFWQAQSRYYYAEPLKYKNSMPKKIRAEILGEFLVDKNFIFYTGAGISAASNVATMYDLEKSLSLTEGKVNFLRKVLFQPDQVAQNFGNFCKSAIDGLPTPAHYALAKIAQQRKIPILTENVDLLQHKTGVQPIHVRNKKIRQASLKDLKEIDYIICIGLSRDDCGFINHYKSQNQEGLIIAIDKGLPDYLSNNDYLVQDDLQVVLPDLAQSLCKK